MGDYQARFCEGLRVKFPRSTRQRFWRTIKRDHVYLYPADNGTELYNGLEGYITRYNNVKSHQGIGRIAPVKLYLQAA